MLDQARTKWFNAYDLPVSTTVSGAINEGACLVGLLENGELAAALSAGSSGELFVGVSYSQMNAPDTGIIVETFTIPASSPYTATLKYAPSPSGLSSVAAHLVSTQVAWTVQSGSPSTTQVQIVGQAVTFAAADAGKIVAITYRYALTVQQARQKAGDGIPGISTPAQEAGSIGVIQKGIVYTDQFNSAKDWNNQPAITTGASGYFTVGGSGATVNGHVVHVPTFDVPFLGVFFQA